MSYGYQPRVIERIRGDAPGPSLIGIGAMHGNEPAGVAVLRTVLGRLRQRGAKIRGDVMGLIGNVRALAAKRRFLARDLNRLWTQSRLEALLPQDPWTTPTTDGAELAEMLELSGELDRALAAKRGSVFVLDLHTTSAPGVAFGVAGATPAHRGFAAKFPMPVIVGLEELLDGVLTRHLATKGCVTLAIEGGQTDSADAGALLEAAITVALAASGCVLPGDLPELPGARDLLTRARGALPPMIDVTLRHEVRPEHEFRMEPGFANIHATPAGTLLARDKRGEIRAPYDGFVLLPLYQAQGNDGFFYGKATTAPVGGRPPTNPAA
ncbi:MAG TPA: succinylglutamate desuccinylase/aspartoacylase family protein [Kofleriaceae bacterium]|nr:succinylglutamate desuccinylase/aspartoacylase family protein [Kofleriaceae bacterium]